jgi:hypothetical protein
MGTNYYHSNSSKLDSAILELEKTNKDGIYDEAIEVLNNAKSLCQIHIGKSSGGWCFALHVNDDIRSLDDWKEKWKDGVITNEYNEKVSPEEMLEIITKRRCLPLKISPIDPWYTSEEDFLAKNNAEIGPNNLLRHKIGRHCIGHGEGTWDLMEGEFS